MIKERLKRFKETQTENTVYEKQVMSQKRRDYERWVKSVPVSSVKDRYFIGRKYRHVDFNVWFVTDVTGVLSLWRSRWINIVLTVWPYFMEKGWDMNDHDVLLITPHRCRAYLHRKRIEKTIREGLMLHQLLFLLPDKERRHYGWEISK